MSNLIVIISAILLFFSCQPSNPPDSFNKKIVIEEVKTMLDDYHNAIKNGGLTAEFPYLDQSSDFFWVPPGYRSALTFDSVKIILEQNAKAFQAIEFHWDTLQLFPLSSEIVNYSGIVSGSMTDTAGIKSRVSIIESGTIIKRQDGWKLLSGQSAVLPVDSTIINSSCIRKS